MRNVLKTVHIGIPPSSRIYSRTSVQQLSILSFIGGESVDVMQGEHSPSGGKRSDWRSKPYRPPLISSHYYHRDHAHYHRGSRSLNPSPCHVRPSRFTWTPPPGSGEGGRSHVNPLPPSPSSQYKRGDTPREGYTPHRRGTPHEGCRSTPRERDTPHSRGTNTGHTPQKEGTPSRGGGTPRRTETPSTEHRGCTPHKGDSTLQRGGTPNRGHTPHRSDTPPRRPRVYVNEYFRDSNKRKYPIISLVSYNLLAQDLLRKNMFLYRTNKPVYLEWDHRKPRLLREILDTHADIFCLQEVQEEHFTDCYYPELKANGYEGIFQKRTGQYSDGCAVFYKSHKLKVIEYQKIQFQKNTGTLIRDNVAILVKFTLSPYHFSSSFTSRTFCIATTHLLFNHKAGEIKLAQMSYLLAELHKMAATKNSKGESILLPSVVCGDFNCLPNSPMLDFLLDSKLDYSRLDATQVTGYQISSPCNRLIPVPLIPFPIGITQDCKYGETKNGKSDDKRASVNGKVGVAYTETNPAPNEATPRVSHPRLTHPFTFHSGYPIFKGSHHQPPTVTTYHRNACETVDYILYTPPSSDHKSTSPTSTGFNIVSRSALPSQHILRQYGPQPNHVYSSDHLYLQVDLQLL